MATNPITPDIARQLDEIEGRLERDPAFRQAAAADLAGTLQAAGLPDDQLHHFVAVSAADKEVSGYVIMGYTKCFPDGTGGEICRKVYQIL